MSTLDAEGEGHPGESPAGVVSSPAASLTAILQWVTAQRATLLALVVLQFVTYSYFFTSIQISNHLFPNIWVQRFPSFRTLYDGRWLGDVVVFLLGGSGIPSVQMILAAILQGINGLLFCHLLGVRRKADALLCSALLCLYPAFLDYYSFTSDHVTFVLGDSFALLGAILSRTLPRPAALLSCGLCFFFSISLYQPKLALISFLVLVVILLELALTAGEPGARRAMRSGSTLVVALMAACVAYWATARLLLGLRRGARAHLSSFGEALEQLRIAFPHAREDFITGAAGVPGRLSWIPLVIVAAGVVTLVLVCRRSGTVNAVAAALVMAAIPLALRAVYVINAATWEHSGRVIAANGYCLVFFLALSLGRGHRAARAVSGAGAVICLVFFFILGTQEANAAQMKSIYELGMIQRIADRAEQTVGRRDEPCALVVVGRYPPFAIERYIRFSGRRLDQGALSYAFAPYRQVQILNFILGHEAFRDPTLQERDAALLSVRDHASWPSRDSVYLLEETLVIVLERPQPDTVATWAGQRKQAREGVGAVLKRIGVSP